MPLRNVKWFTKHFIFQLEFFNKLSELIVRHLKTLVLAFVVRICDFLDIGFKLVDVHTLVFKLP